MQAQRSGTPSLRGLQARFYDLVTQPGGVATALRSRGEDPAELARVIRGDEHLSAVERLDIYANMYFFRILDVLRGDYPKLLSIVGDVAFHNLVTDYLIAHRPRDPSLRNVGDRLPEYVPAHALGRERLWLAELAALERLRIEVFDGPDVEPLSLEQLKRCPPQLLGELPIQLIPSLRVQEVSWDADGAWRSQHDGQSVTTVPLAPGTVIVWRAEPFVYQRRLDDDERGLASLLAAGTTVGAVCERLSEDNTAEASIALAFELLSRWIADAIIVTGQSDRRCSPGVLELR